MIRFIGSNTLHYTSEQTSVISTVKSGERYELLDALQKYLAKPAARVQPCELGILTDQGCKLVFSFNYHEAKALKNDLEISIREFRE